MTHLFSTLGFFSILKWAFVCFGLVGSSSPTLNRAVVLMLAALEFRVFLIPWNQLVLIKPFYCLTMVLIRWHLNSFILKLWKQKFLLSLLFCPYLKCSSWCQFFFYFLWAYPIPHRGITGSGRGVLNRYPFHSILFASVPTRCLTVSATLLAGDRTSALGSLCIV